MHIENLNKNTLVMFNLKNKKSFFMLELVLCILYNIYKFKYQKISTKVRKYLGVEKYTPVSQLSS